MMTKKNRRKRKPLAVTPIPSKRVIDGIARCRLTQSQKDEFARLSGVVPDRLEWWTHEFELIIEKFWYEDARFAIWPSNSELVATFTEVAQATVLLKRLLSGASIRILLKESDLSKNAKRFGICGRFHVEEFADQLNDLIARAECLAATPRGREQVWAMSSNRQDRPYDRFLSNLIQFWYIELKKVNLVVDVKADGTQSAIVIFVRFASGAAGRPISPHSVKSRLASVLAQMDENDDNRRINELPPTKSWRAD